jgi:hypothetical protein
MPVVWPLAFLWMSVACALNARRCGRVHCYFTGAFFFVMATLSAIHGFELVNLGGDAWSWMGITAAVGGGALTFLPEMIWGRYRKSTSSDSVIGSK